jgi:hypothetical protein
MRTWRLKQRMAVQAGRCCKFCGELLGRRALQRRDVRYCSLRCKRAAQKLRPRQLSYWIGVVQRQLAERRHEREIEGRTATESEAAFEARVEADIARGIAKVEKTRADVIAWGEAKGYRLTPEEIDALVLAVDLGAEVPSG